MMESQLPVGRLSDRCCVVQLPDGRRFSYASYGNPAGIPVFYAHGTPGSRLEGAFFHEMAYESGIWLICPERSGIGHSDFQADVGFQQYADDVKFLARSLGISQWALVGWSSGGPPTLACTLSQSRQLRAVVVVGSYSNFAEFPWARALLLEHQQLAPTIAQQSHWLFRTLLHLTCWAERYLPPLYLELVRRSAVAADLAILDQEEVRAKFMNNQDEAFCQGINGVAQDLELAYQDWGFRLQAIDFPVQLWQGRQDEFVPWQFADHLAQCLPQAQLRYFPRQGHFFLLDQGFQRQLWHYIQRCWQTRAGWTRRTAGRYSPSVAKTPASVRSAR